MHFFNCAAQEELARLTGSTGREELGELEVLARLIAAAERGGERSSDGGGDGDGDNGGNADGSQGSGGFHDHRHSEYDEHGHSGQYDGGTVGSENTHDNGGVEAARFGRQALVSVAGEQSGVGEDGQPEDGGSRADDDGEDVQEGEEYEDDWE